MKTLPKIMVAPNGARKLKADHPAIPLSISETVETAVACYHAGATGLHLHVRNPDGSHSLDAQLYKQALAELNIAVPELDIQITTESVGQYTPAQQRQVVTDVAPQSVSVSLAEMLSEGITLKALNFYKQCHNDGIAVQHILYGQDDLTALSRLLDSHSISADGLQLLFVLGRYTQNQQSSPADLNPFLAWMNKSSISADWALCAFGTQETACLYKGFVEGGKARVGFENSFSNEDGSLAIDNAQRVAEVKSKLTSMERH
ncbi:MAG: 3-keto-5-aminohexanoate cleavage protein [Granulosicoccus sp.]